MDDLPPIVVDSSVAVALVRGEPSAILVRIAIREWADASRTLMVPSLFWLEVLNPLARSYGARSDDLLQAIEVLDALELETVDLDRTLLLLTIDHIERYDLTACDAHYLALASQQGADLATLDAKLGAAAGPHRVALGVDHRLHETRAPYGQDVAWPRHPQAAAYLTKARVRATTA